jgi:predicted ATPase/class 3 adenylate cyclase/Tfp pilus assembly protein PilF
MNEPRALLLTDVVDSTQLAERLGDAAAAELNAAHDRVARDLLRAWQGREIDKTDGMLMLFERAEDALGFAIGYHAALATLPLPLKARAGLHVGSVILRMNPPEDVAHGAKPLEVEGIAKPIAARVMSLAQGGQTLLTAEARAALGDTMRRLQSHGFWRIKGIAEPVELFEAGDDAAPFTPPPDSAKVYRVVRRDELWLPLREVRHSLPAERDAFVGRRDALAALLRRLDEGARLVSVLGIGGIGKTRLAVHFGWTWLGDFPGGVWFCDLSAARDLEGIARAVAKGLDVELGGGDALQQLGHAIAGRGDCLVILDNFEQVARLADETIGRWLDRAHKARFVVTTREVLGLPGEEALALAPLTPHESGMLFERRAASARLDYAVAASDAAAVAPLVGLLDGLPLAIELAAARVRAMSPRELLARMDRRLSMLTAKGGRHDRQATLRATFDWSWDLLSGTERSALAQLSVFEGGFTIDAAEAVLELPTLDGPAVSLDVLQALVDKSLVQRVAAVRFGLLVSVQEYAAERLHESADGANAAERRHAAYYSSRESNGAEARIEIANCLAALRRVEASGDAAMAVSLLERSWVGLQQSGPFGVAVALAQRMLEPMRGDAAFRARVSWVLGDALDHCGRGSEAYEHLECAAALFETSGDRVGRARALRKLGDLDITLGRATQAHDRFASALEAARERGLAALEVDVLTSMGNLADADGRSDDALRLFRDAIGRALSTGDRRREGAAYGNLAVLCAGTGRMDEALRYHRAALAAADATEDRSLQGNTLVNMGMLQQLLGDDAAARDSLERALTIVRDCGDVLAEAVALCNLGIAYESADRPTARSYYEAAVALARALANRHLEGLFLGYLGRLHGREARHAEAAQCLDAGQALLETALDRVGLGILMCSRAEAAHLAGDDEAARRALTVAQRTADTVGAGRDSELGMALERLRGVVGAA